MPKFGVANPNHKMKKYLLIILAIATVLGGGYLIWRFFFAEAPLPEQPIGDAADRQELEKLFASAGQVFDYWVNKNTGEAYYVLPEGEIRKISPTGEDRETGSRATGNLSHIKPSSDGSMILVAFGYPQNPTFAIHDLSKKTWQAMPAGTTAVAWDPRSNSRIAYLKDNGAVNRLYTLNLSNNRSTELLRFSQKDLDLDWVLPNLIYFKEKPSAQSLSSVWSFDLKTRALKTLIKDESGLMVRWHADGASGFKLNSNGFANSLTWIDQDNRDLARWDFVTLPNKCALLRDMAYCAIPGNLTAGTRLPDDYLKGAFVPEDNLFAIDLITSEFTILPVDQILPLDADRLEVFGNQLLFINRYDKKLYSLGI